MEYVFGSTFVCKTTDSAREVGWSYNGTTPTFDYKFFSVISLGRATFNACFDIVLLA